MAGWSKKGALAVPNKSMPLKIGKAVFILDESGTLKNYVPGNRGIVAKAREAVEERIGKMALRTIYALFALFSGRCVVGEFDSLDRVECPSIEEGGHTPLGEILSATVAKCRDFKKVTTEMNTRISKEYLLLFSDLIPSHELEAVTEMGFKDLEEYVKEFNPTLILCTPPRHACHELNLARMEAMGAKVEEIEKVDPSKLMEFIVDSIVGASMVPTGSNVPVSNMVLNGSK